MSNLWAVVEKLDRGYKGPMATVEEILAAAREKITELGPAELAALGERPLLIDVRESDEQAQGRIPGAVGLPRGFLELRIAKVAPDPAAPLVLYCAGGTRSLLAARSLRELGYTDVRSLAGGFLGWVKAGLPVDKGALGEAARRRYARHLRIPEIGEAGQAKLLASRVLVVGAGGLGSPAAYYLAAAGVGTLGIVDDDFVDESNLQRQILHTAGRVGMPKVESARRTLAEFNPSVEVVGFAERLTPANVDRILDGFTLVIDGSDNFATRYLLSDAAVKHRKPCVHGSVHRFEGQVTVLAPAQGGPCYRCLFPAPPPRGLAPSCAEAGVLGTVPGVVGLLQATEAVKVLLGIGRPLVGKLLVYDAMQTTFREMAVSRDMQCVMCAPGRAFRGYVEFTDDKCAPR